MPFNLYGQDPVTSAPPRQEGVVPGAPVQTVRPVQREERPPPRRPSTKGPPPEDGGAALQAYAQTARPGFRQPALHAHQIMSTPVTTLTVSDTLVDAWTLFRQTRYRHIPVVDGQGRLSGIVSDRDLLRYAAVNGRVPPYDGDSPEASTPISTLMKPRVLTATPDTEIRQIARVLIEQHIGAMPIMDYGGRLRGIVTRSDILRALVTHAPLELWV